MDLFIESCRNVKRDRGNGREIKSGSINEGTY